MATLPISKILYREKLLDPLWQQRKSAIQIRDQFTCQKCGAKDKTLHVHHRHYVTGRNPWDYPDNLLITLCAPCHADEELYADIGQNMLEVLHNYGYFNTEVRDILNKLIQDRTEKPKING